MPIGVSTGSLSSPGASAKAALSKESGSCPFLTYPRDPPFLQVSGQSLTIFALRARASIRSSTSATARISWRNLSSIEVATALVRVMGNRERSTGLAHVLCFKTIWLHSIADGNSTGSVVRCFLAAGVSSSPSLDAVSSGRGAFFVTEIIVDAASLRPFGFVLRAIGVTSLSFGDSVEATVQPGHMRKYSRLLSATENESPTCSFTGSSLGARFLFTKVPYFVSRSIKKTEPLWW
mmetsp:Transcript_34869/g.62320  ORF Transcript_34869/g.62320 Transcript_34869/m.62320 type:complete len:235 (-) Transcript_34869:277-981(-)